MSYYVVSSEYVSGYSFSYAEKFRGEKYIITDRLAKGYSFARDVTQDDLGIRCSSDLSPPVMLWEDLDAKHISNS